MTEIKTVNCKGNKIRIKIYRVWDEKDANYDTFIMERVIECADEVKIKIE